MLKAEKTPETSGKKKDEEDKKYFNGQKFGVDHSRWKEKKAQLRFKMRKQNVHTD